MLSDALTDLVRQAFASMVRSENQMVRLSDLIEVYLACDHPAVQVGDMAPSAAKETLLYQFGECSKDHDGYITFDEFETYHKKVAEEAFASRPYDANTFLEKFITRLWRLGDLLAPTGIRPVFPITEMPKGLYSETLMSLVWPGVDANGQKVLYCVKDTIQPIFRRGDLPPDLRGFFAFPGELTGFRLQYVQPQISIKRWLDFVWEYDEGKYAAVEGIISARISKDSLPTALQVLIQEHVDVKKLPHCQFLETQLTINPMYRKTSEAYGYRVVEECQKIARWKWSSLTGKEYGLQYHGFTSSFFSKNGPPVSNAETGINI